MSDHHKKHATHKKSAPREPEKSVQENEESLADCISSEGAVEPDSDSLTAQNELLEENAKLKEALQLAMNKAEEFKDSFLRAKAETENIRRRSQEEISKAHKFAVEKFAADLLAVKDSLDAALLTKNQSLENLNEGVVLIEKQLNSAFEKNALHVLNPLGEKFNPHQHQAIGYVESDLPKESVAQVLQKGYLIAERVLRPALVMVSSGKAQEVQSDSKEESGS